MGRLDIPDPPRDEDQLPGGRNYGISLTPLELECLKAIAEGERVTVTALRLHYSRWYILDIRKKVLTKLDAKNKALAVRRGFEYGFLT